MKTIKRHIRLCQRTVKDLLSGTRFRFATKGRTAAPLQKTIELVQEIKQHAQTENKIFNLKLAAQSINQVILKPGTIFSFWHIIGNPNTNYKTGRVISGGQLTEDTGGGLCQISGAVYYTSLKAGLQILERHHHSIDLYTNDTRYTPLGTDATVVYGYKDLRIKNNYDFPIQFHIDVNDQFLTIRLLSAEKIIEKKLDIEIKDEDDHVVSIIKQDDTLIQSRYIKHKE
jgi:vancomycin resistance protein VanW